MISDYVKKRLDSLLSFLCIYINLKKQEHCGLHCATFYTLQSPCFNISACRRPCNPKVIRFSALRSVYDLPLYGYFFVFNKSSTVYLRYWVQSTPNKIPVDWEHMLKWWQPVVFPAAIFECASGIFGDMHLQFWLSCLVFLLCVLIWWTLFHHPLWGACHHIPWFWPLVKSVGLYSLLCLIQNCHFNSNNETQLVLNNNTRNNFTGNYLQVLLMCVQWQMNCEWSPV